MTLALRPGPRHFQVEELPAYLPCGQGEHVFIEIEKENLTTAWVAEALARLLGRRSFEIGYAGRKDRHAITRQRLSFSLREDPAPLLERLLQRVPQDARLEIHSVDRHRNKLKPGHLTGNRFRLGLTGADPGLAERLQQLAVDGIPNAFGAQRFGVAGTNLHVARAWAAHDLTTVVEHAVDPRGAWHWGQPVPAAWRPEPEASIAQAVARGADALTAVHAGGPGYRRWIASCGQSAIFNAVLQARRAAGLLHTPRPGEVVCGRSAAPFLVKAEELDSLRQRAAPGQLQIRCTGPLPGGETQLLPDPAILAEEQAWSAEVGIPWSAFDAQAVLASHGERRPLLVAFVEPPTIDTGSDATWLTFALPAGSYATEVLAALGVSVPDDRSGHE